MAAFRAKKSRAEEELEALRVQNKKRKAAVRVKKSREAKAIDQAKDRKRKAEETKHRTEEQLEARRVKDRNMPAITDPTPLTACQPRP